MVNTRIKGNRTVRRAIDYYTAEGWLVDKVEKVGKWILHKDLFSEACGIGFDLVGIKQNQVIFIQAKTNLAPDQHKYFDFAQKYCGPNLLAEMYVWHDGRGPVIYKFIKDGIIKTDLRKK